MKNKIFKSITLLFLALSLSACAKNTRDTKEATRAEITVTTPQGEKITIPKDVSRVVSLSPAVTQVIDELGQKKKLIAVDSQSPKYVKGLDKLDQTDIMSLDLEKILALKPELLFVTDLTMFQSSDAIKKIQEKGTKVIVLPSEKSLAEIESNIKLVATSLDQKASGEKIVSQMEKEIADIKKQAESITNRKSVLFQIAASPEIYSMGKETFINEMIEDIGATNVMAKETGSIKVSEEAAIMSNPDVILTNVNYIPHPVDDILQMKSWAEVKAVKNKDVYAIDNERSSLPNHHVVQAMKEMAKVVYPDVFKNIK
ncbi:ABC transporter substrate-binding protein [Lactococcus garvieae]|uniref:ABC transporter substrate-binding protein n=1 Tax=Lactococcus garvieae TaxID=1363 RepID=UPI0009BFFFA2|nr:ABC transporter substrate-binding protein [Lactococcus garvieae]